MKTTFSYYIRQFSLSANVKPYSSLYEKKKSILLTLFLYFFFAVIFTFLIINIIKNDLFFMLIDGFNLFISLILIYFLKIKGRLHEVSNIFVGTIFILTTYLILSGGLRTTGIIFSLLIPLPVILLLGKKRGIRTLILLFTINMGGLLFFHNASWYPQYDPGLLSRLSIVFVLISLMAYSNEYVFELLYLRLEKVTDTLKISQERYKNLAINKEKFLSLISHDLNGHIGNFAAISNMLHEQYEVMKEDEKKKLISQLAHISEQNFSLLQDLLKWSTVQNETIPYQPTAVKLERIYREIIPLFERMIEEKKLSVFFKMKSNSEVFADYDMLSSILRNLVSNAIKYSTTNGEIRISAVERNDSMLISVSDKGVGFDSEDLLRVNASVSFSNPGTFDEAGTGIGLILVREFVQKNKGEFFMESELGKGTNASFTIPLSL